MNKLPRGMTCPKTLGFRLQPARARRMTFDYILQDDASPDAFLIAEGNNLQRAAEELVHLVAQPLPQVCRLPHRCPHFLWPHYARIQCSLLRP